MTKWKQAVLASTAIVGMVGPAAAADLAYKAAAPVAYVNTWEGLYIGIHAGAASQDSTCSPISGGTNPVGCAGWGFLYYGSGDHRVRSTSALVGVEIAHNWQSRNFVYGVAADWSWTGLKGNSAGCSGSCSYEAKVNWLASFRGRAGLAVENTMLYVTGGLALAGVKNTTWAGDPNSLDVNSTHKTAIGWVAGAGVEHMFNQRWSIKGEVLHYDFTNVDGGRNQCMYDTSCSYHLSYNTDHTINVARVGLSYKIW